MKVKTSELTGVALDWAVAKCEGVPLIYRGRKWPTDGATTVEYAPWAVHPVVDGSGPYVPVLCHSSYKPSTNWEHGGTIIDRYDIDVLRDGDEFGARLGSMRKHPQREVMSWFTSRGPTKLTAAMRCLVTSRLGDEIEVPDELMACSNREAEASQDQANAQRPRSRA